MSDNRFQHVCFMNNIERCEKNRIIPNSGIILFFAIIVMGTVWRSRVFHSFLDMPFQLFDFLFNAFVVGLIDNIGRCIVFIF